MTIELKDVQKSFGPQSILLGVSLRMGLETVGLLGANGSGKTTLLKCILNVLEFDGTITLDGKNIRYHTRESKSRMGYIPQHFPFWPGLDVTEVMRFMGALRRVSEKRQNELLEEFDLAAHGKKAVSALSGGMRQKLSIAIALLSDPDILLLDEPTASLDVWATGEILRILGRWKGRKAILLSSHRIEEMRGVCHRLVELQNGVLHPRVQSCAQ